MSRGGHPHEASSSPVGRRVRADRRTGVGLRSEPDLRQLRGGARAQTSISAPASPIRSWDWRAKKARWPGRSPRASSTASRSPARRSSRPSLATRRIGDKFSNYLPMRSVLFYDTRATAAQREALRAFVTLPPARTSASSCAKRLRRSRSSRRAARAIRRRAITTGTRARSPACIKVAAGNLVRLETRNILHTDHLCASPELFGAPLSRGVRNDIPVYVPQMAFSGQGLGSTWSIPDTRGGFVADFEIAAPPK